MSVDPYQQSLLNHSWLQRLTLKLFDKNTPYHTTDLLTTFWKSSDGIFMPSLLYPPAPFLFSVNVELVRFYQYHP